MDLFARAETERLAKAEQEKRRKMRIVQVRQQTTDWMMNTRKEYKNAKNKQIQKIISDMSNERQQEMVNILQEIVKSHEEGVEEIGSAHRAAEHQLKLQSESKKLQEIAQVERYQLAVNRHLRALKTKRENMIYSNEPIRAARNLKDKVRQEENFVAKNLVTELPYGTLSTVPVRPTSIKKQELQYQQSPTKYLNIPMESKEPKKAGRRKPQKIAEVAPKEKLRIRAPIKPSLFERIAEERAAGASTPVLVHQESEYPKITRKVGPGGDVQFFDACIPSAPKKYRPPPGLAKREPQNITLSAWRESATITKTNEAVELHRQLDLEERERRAEIRGKRALRIAKLEQRYKQLEAELLEGGGGDFGTAPDITKPTLALSGVISPKCFDNEDEHDGLRSEKSESDNLSDDESLLRFFQEECLKSSEEAEYYNESVDSDDVQYIDITDVEESESDSLKSLSKEEDKSSMIKDSSHSSSNDQPQLRPDSSRSTSSRVISSSSDAIDKGSIPVDTIYPKAVEPQVAAETSAYEGPHFERKSPVLEILEILSQTSRQEKEKEAEVPLQQNLESESSISTSTPQSSKHSASKSNSTSISDNTPSSVFPPSSHTTDVSSGRDDRLSSSSSTLAVVKILTCPASSSESQVLENSDSSLSYALNSLCIQQKGKVDAEKNNQQQQQLDLSTSKSAATTRSRSSRRGSNSTSSILNRAKELLNADKENIKQIFAHGSDSETCSSIKSGNSKEIHRGSFGLALTNLPWHSSMTSDFQTISELPSSRTVSAFQKLTEELSRVTIQKPAWLN